MHNTVLTPSSVFAASLRLDCYCGWWYYSFPPKGATTHASNPNFSVRFTFSVYSFWFKIYCSVQYFASCSQHGLLPLTAVLQVLLEESTQRVPAALHGLAVFVDTLRLLVEAQQSVNAPSVSPPHSLLAQPKEGSGILSTTTPMEDDQQAAMLAQSADDAGAAAIDSAEAKRPKEVSPSAGIDALTSSLMPSPQA